MNEALIVFDALLVITLGGLAAASVLSTSLFRAVVLFMVFGLVMALAWARLRAPDIAIAEVALGAGLTGAMMLFAVSSLKKDDNKKGKG